MNGAQATPQKHPNSASPHALSQSGASVAVRLYMSTYILVGACCSETQELTWPTACCCNRRTRDKAGSAVGRCRCALRAARMHATNTGTTIHCDNLILHSYNVLQSTAICIDGQGFRTVL